ncbi:MAG: hypothetical protein HWE16_06910 [Gammaproteobacteria bacterium]|nr:hypothetical protein [Gammaproteobacteria bacterium]
MKKAVDFLTNESELAPNYVRLLSLIFLLICGSLAFFEYTAIKNWWPDTSVVFKPRLISTMIAIFVIAPLYMRGILKWSISVYGIISLLLILLVFSSFVELALGGNRASNIIYALIGASLILSWLGMSAVAGFGWIFTFAAGITALIVNNIAMGFYGFIYVATGFLGLILHSDLTPASLIQGFKEEFIKSNIQLPNVTD